MNIPISRAARRKAKRPGKAENTMQQAVQDQYGAPQVLSLEETAMPTPAADQVLIQVHAAAVTQGDRRLRAADFPGASAVFGRLLFGLTSPRNRTGGTMFAGKVVAVGTSVVNFKVGDEVFGSVDSGAYSEFITVSADGRLARIPRGIDYAEAAAATYGASTALSFLRDIAKVEAGERVLIVGASGGVGRYAVQIARHLGAEVTAVCSARHAELVRELGASEVIDYQSEDYTRLGKNWDVIFDTSSGDGFGEAWKCLSDNGRYVTVYMNLKVMTQGLTSSLRGGPTAKGGIVLGTPELIGDVADLLKSGAITPRIAGRFPLAQIADAHQALEGGNPGGDIVVTMGEQARRVTLAPQAVAA
jgi:NADPH:quinone reductase-like Zn-dependent oxidoreductase